MFTSNTKIRVRYAETDQMRVVYHGNFAEYFESSRTESIRQLGLTYKELEAMGILMPVVELHCRFIRPAFYDDLLTVRTILKELPAGHRIEFHHEVLNEKDELLATGRVVLYFVKAKSMEKAVIPDAFVEKVKPFFSN
jgi:acyl-CoA thioester hydrolase